MQVIDSAKLVYLNPPRTATTTIDWQLRSQGLKVWAPKEFAGHATLWDDKWADYFVFLTVRSPWTRAVSLWKRIVQAMQHRTAEQREVLKNGRITFDEHLFVDYYQDWWHNVVAHRFTEGVPHVDLVLHVETLAADFRGIPGVKWLIGGQQLNLSRDKSPWHEHYTPRCIDKVLEVFADDFEHYGYTRDFEEAKRGKFFA